MRMDYGKVPKGQGVNAEHAGDPIFHQITKDEITLYNRKNFDYAGGGSDPNGNFNRVSAILAMYPGLSLSDPRVVAFVYMMKQVDQVLFSLSRGFEGKVEGIDARMMDVHVYAKIVRVLDAHIREDAQPAEHNFAPGWTTQ